MRKTKQVYNQTLIERKEKVFTTEDVRCIRCCVVENAVGKVMFVSFSILHKLPYVNDETILQLSKEKLTFTFSQSHTKLTTHAMGDFPNEFYDEQQAELDEIEAQLQEAKAEESSIELQETIIQLKEKRATLKETEVKENVRIWFREVAQTKPKRISHNLSSLKHASYFTTHPDTKMCSVLLGVPIDKHRKKIVKKIYKIITTLPYINVDVHVKKPTGNKTQNQGKSEKNKISFDGVKLNIDWYKFFCDLPVLKAEMKDMSSTIIYSGIIVSVDNTLTYNQKINMNPIVIRLNNLNNLPQRYIDKYRIQKVFLQYCLPDICGIVKTDEVDVKSGKLVRIKHCNLNFIGYHLHGPDSVDQSVLTVSQRLQTQFLAIKIFGKFEIIKNQIEPCVFGQHPLDAYISEYHTDMENCPMKPSDETTVLLGTAKCDLSCLMYGHLIHECNVNVNSERIFFKSMMNLSSLQDINYKETEYAPFIPEIEFVKNGTYLQVMVKVASRLQFPSLNQTLSFPESYSRIIVLFHDDEKAVEVLREIQLYNRQALKDTNTEEYGKNESIYDISYESSEMSLPSFKNVVLNNKENLSLKRIITGFFVANSECNILVAEGLTNFSFPILLQLVFNLPTQYGCVLQNSCIIFNKRLYQQFLEDKIEGGIFILAPDEDLDSLLLSQSTYLSKNAAKTAWQTLKMFKAICDCKTLTAVCQNELFPTVQQLFSFESEFCTKNYIKRRAFTGSRGQLAIL